MTECFRISLWATLDGQAVMPWMEVAPTFGPLRGREVLIWAGEHNSYWGPEGRSYYDKNKAGIYFFHDAYARTQHCGPEKQIAYELIESKLTNAYFSMRCSWIAKEATR